VQKLQPDTVFPLNYQINSFASGVILAVYWSTPTSVLGKSTEFNAKTRRFPQHLIDMLHRLVDKAHIVGICGNHASGLRFHVVWKRDEADELPRACSGSIAPHELTRAVNHTP
jgi:hypothetical protein